MASSPIVQENGFPVAVAAPLSNRVVYAVLSVSLVSFWLAIALLIA